jgi:hypothetical protein
MSSQRSLRRWARASRAIQARSGQAAAYASPASRPPSPLPQDRWLPDQGRRRGQRRPRSAGGCGGAVSVAPRSSMGRGMVKVMAELISLRRRLREGKPSTSRLITEFQACRGTHVPFSCACQARHRFKDDSAGFDLHGAAASLHRSVSTQNLCYRPLTRKKRRMVGATDLSSGARKRPSSTFCPEQKNTGRTARNEHTLAERVSALQ